MSAPPIAFIDVETTGLDPAENRVAEIGIVFLDGDRVSEWSCLLALGARRLRIGSSVPIDPDAEDGPSFKDIAVDLERRLLGHLLVAHNARFDYSFLKAEFERAGIDFSAEVLCSLMLSRSLYPDDARHDLDSLMVRHGLESDVRHRALPDARLLLQLWRVIHREHDSQAIEGTIARQLAGPVMPDLLDPALIERLPDSAGVYLFYDAEDQVLQVGKAGNLRLHLLNYFRLDRASTKALLLAQRVTKITWRVTQGMIGAHLLQATLRRTLLPAKGRAKRDELFSWQLNPECHPCLALVPASLAARFDQPESFGLFATERKARNALSRLAAKQSLCRSMLGIADPSGQPCSACAGTRHNDSPVCNAHRVQQLLRVFVALRDLRIAPWPHQGPIGVREGRDLHVVDQWCYLGTVRHEAEIEEALNVRPESFDSAVFHFLKSVLSTLPQRRIVDLSARSTPSGSVRATRSPFAEASARQELLAD